MITEKQKKTISFCVLISFILFCAAVGWFIGRPMIQFVSDPQQFRDWVDESGLWGRIAFVLMMMFQVVIAFVPGEPLEIGAGYAFGAIEGTILCVIGITLSSLFVFTLVRKFGVKLVEVFFTFEKIKSAKFLQNQKKLEILTYLMFFLPGTPKDLLTYILGLTKIQNRRFVLIASLARLPSVVTSTIGGSLLGTEKYMFAIIVFAITLVISIVGWLLYNYINNKRC